MPKRCDMVDALRGLAMVWMTIFHFCFDLNYFGLWTQNFRVDPFWTVQRTLIVSLFLFCAGLGQAIAWHQGQSWVRFIRRWVQIVGCALLVSAGSFAMFPQTYIYFGVLHGMAAMLVIARLTTSWGRWLWFMGLIALALPPLAHYLLSNGGDHLAPWFNGQQLNWIGLVSRKPLTEDYVPVLPWLGVLWWGLAAGQWLIVHRSKWLHMSLPVAGTALASLGRWSLSYYMVHQPAMLGVIVAFVWLFGKG